LNGVALASLLILSLASLGVLYVLSTTLLRGRPLVLTRVGLVPIALLVPALAALLRTDLLPAWAGVFGLQTLLLMMKDVYMTVGVGKADVANALKRAVNGTQTTATLSPRGAQLAGPSGTIVIRTMLPRFQLITLNLHRGSKRHRLLKKVFKKFVQNCRL
jgi:hypothetical protein